MKNDKKLPGKSNFWEKIKNWWVDNEVNKLLFLIFTLSLPVMVGYIIAINLSIMHQVIISILIILFLFIIHIDWDNISSNDIFILSFVFVLILIGMIIGDIVYYFVWYDDSINWLKPFVPN